MRRRLLSVISAPDPLSRRSGVGSVMAPTNCPTYSPPQRRRVRMLGQATLFGPYDESTDDRMGRHVVRVTGHKVAPTTTRRQHRYPESNSPSAADPSRCIATTRSRAQGQGDPARPTRRLNRAASSQHRRRTQPNRPRVLLDVASRGQPTQIRTPLGWPGLPPPTTSPISLTDTRVR